MKLEYNKRNILTQLHDELIKAGANAIVEGIGDTIYITIQDESQKEIVDNVVNNHVPDFTAIEKEKTRQEIMQQLDDIDRKSIRALRAGESNRLLELEARAQKLREQLRQ